MKLQAILKRCKKRKYIHTIEYDGAKFLSDGIIAVCTERIAPKWTSADYLTAMEITDEERNVFNIVEEGERSLREKHTEQLARAEYSLNINGITVQPFYMTDGKVFFADMDDLEIFANEPNKEYYCIPGHTEEGICIKSDYGFTGVVLPTRLNLNDVESFLSCLQKGVKKSADTGFLDLGGQISIENM